MVASATVPAVAMAEEGPPVTDVDLDAPRETSPGWRSIPLESQFVESNHVALEGTFAQTGGVAITRGLDAGAYVRLTAEALLGPQPRTAIGPVFGFGWGISMWGNADARGFDMPIGVFTGIRFKTGRIHHAMLVQLRALVAASLFEVDVVHRVPGGGIFAPNAGGDLTIGSNWFRLGVEARATYRWEWGIEDRSPAADRWSDPRVSVRHGWHESRLRYLNPRRETSILVADLASPRAPPWRRRWSCLDRAGASVFGASAG